MPSVRYPASMANDDEMLSTLPFARIQNCSDSEAWHYHLGKHLEDDMSV